MKRFIVAIAVGLLALLIVSATLAAACNTVSPPVVTPSCNPTPNSVSSFCPAADPPEGSVWLSYGTADVQSFTYTEGVQRMSEGFQLPYCSATWNPTPDVPSVAGKGVLFYWGVPPLANGHQEAVTGLVIGGGGESLGYLKADDPLLVVPGACKLTQ